MDSYLTWFDWAVRLSQITGSAHGTEFPFDRTETPWQARRARLLQPDEGDRGTVRN
ncbi:MAG: hypothetical protein H8K07_04240 [Nitrospira sp.]|nr:hypothetical protein [Nitrospira sp.]MDI3464640.1 hypothetical protein [Nitrospira sp.]